MSRSNILTTAIVGFSGAALGSLLMMLYIEHNVSSNLKPPTSGTISGNLRTDGPSLDDLVAKNTRPAISDQDRIIAAVKRVEPSVVALNVVVNGTQVVPTDPFGQMFGGGGTGMIEHFHARASGSGFVYSSDGLIVTNAHVVENASNISILFQNGDHVNGHVFASDSGEDIALIKVDKYAKLPPPLELGDSSKLAQGQWALAIGEPLELKQTVTLGVVSGFNRDETIGSEGGGIPRAFKGLMQTSAAINPGNSGGPLVDIDGRVIGVNQSTASPQYAQGIGFAIPVNTMKTTVEALIKNPGTHTGQLTGFIGVELTSLDNNVRSQLNYLGNGAAIVNVVSGSAADTAGLEPGDVIQQINGISIHGPQDVTRTIGNMHPGQDVTITIWSGGNQKRVTLKVGERPIAGP